MVLDSAKELSAGPNASRPGSSNVVSSNLPLNCLEWISDRVCQKPARAIKQILGEEEPRQRYSDTSGGGLWISARKSP